MAQPSSNTPNWLPYAGFALALAGVVYQGGVQSSTISQNTARITKLEAQASSQSEIMNKINERGAGNQAKLDFLVEQAERNRK